MTDSNFAHFCTYYLCNSQKQNPQFFGSKVVWFGGLGPTKLPPLGEKTQFFHKNGFLSGNLDSGQCMHSIFL